MMMPFWLIAAALLLAALSCVMVPLLRRAAVEPTDVAVQGEHALSVAIYRVERLEIEREFAQGHLSAEHRARAQHELERRLIDETRCAFAGAAAAARSMGLAQRAGTAAVLLALLPLAALVLYLQLGDPLAMAVQVGGESVAADAHTAMQGSLDVVAGKLAARLRQQPGDAAGWTLLARSYAALERAGDAAAAYRRALSLTPRDPQLMADYADALASANGGDLNGVPLQSIQAALALDPANPKALALAGSAARDRRDYPVAIDYWERLERVSGADSEIGVQAREDIAQARGLKR
jgi:cytochrome c-type biogenesis protein CcmH